MSLTAFGMIFLPLSIALAWWRPRWLPGLLPVAAVFQAPAVIIVGSGQGALGITPFNATAALVAAAWLAALHREAPPAWVPGERHIATAWFAFLAWCVAGAMLMPLLFAGVELYPLAVREAMNKPAEPLRWTFTHLAQGINCGVLAILFVTTLWRRDREVLAATWLRGAAVALLAALAASAFQRAAMLGGFDLQAGFWGSNPGYNQFFHTPGYGPAFGRAGLPFNEPSYASVWFAAAASASLAAFMFVRTRRPVSLLLCGASLAGLANTIGTTGLLAFTAFALALSAALLSPLGRDVTPFPRRVALVILCGTMLTMIFVLYQVTWGTAPVLAPLREAVDWTLYKFSGNAGAQFRGMANLQAWRVLIDTFGLGAGTGSVRSSSYAFGLAANAGLPGLVLFATACALQIKALWRLARAGSARAVWALGATGGMLLGVLAGISDQNWPALWCVLLGGFAVARMPAPEGRASRS